MVIEQNRQHVQDCFLEGFRDIHIVLFTLILIPICVELYADFTLFPWKRYVSMALVYFSEWRREVVIFKGRLVARATEATETRI